MKTPSIRGLRGCLLDTPSRGNSRFIRDGAVLIEGARILDAGEFERLRELPEARGLHWEYGTGCVILPGLMDLHAHLPQYPAVARREESLLPWLERHIFPLERNFNAATARQLAPGFFRDLAAAGTTTACLYAAIYEESCHECFTAAEASGLRVFLGKVMMDRGSYGSLEPEKVLDVSLLESRRLLNRWHGAAQGRLQYVVSPRFAVSCTDLLLRSAAGLARETGAWIQTHLSENVHEIELVRALFPEAESYTDVYKKCGLLGPKTLLAHCIHLSSKELAEISDSGSIIAHCPTSNLFLGSGIFRMDDCLSSGTKIVLGSDVAGGPELNLWQVMRSALESQTARSFYTDCEVPSPETLLYFATQGAAQALGMEQELGSLDPGKLADLVIFDLGKIVPGGRKPNFEADFSGAEILTLLLYRGGPVATLETLVNGSCVYTAPVAGLL